MSGLSGVGGLIPIPGISVGLDIGLLSEEVIFYIYKLNLTQSSIQELARTFQVDYKNLETIIDKYPIVKSTIQITNIGVNLLKEGFKYVLELMIKPMIQMLTKYLSGYLAANSVEEIVKVALPGIGSLVGAFISSSTTYYSLTHILDNYEKALLEIYDYCIQNSRN